MTTSSPAKRILVLVSGSGSNLQAIIDNCETGYIHADVVGVISNVANVYALERAHRHNIPKLVLDHKLYGSREQFDDALATCVDGFSADLIVLAGFMRILSDSFVAKYIGKIINIHPSLLPKYPGLHTHKRAIENQDKKHGASVHFVTAELDGGPVVVQSSVNIDISDSEISLQEKVVQTEWQIYPLAIKWFCQGALRLQQEQVWFNNELVESSLERENKKENKIDFEMMIHNIHGNQCNEDIH